MEYSKQDRRFLSPEEAFCGKSVVQAELPGSGSELARDMWPRSLDDYLRRFTSRRVRVKYSTEDGRTCERQGRLAVVGSNFLGLRTEDADDLLVLRLESVLWIDVAGGRRL